MKNKASEAPNCHRTMIAFSPASLSSLLLLSSLTCKIVFSVRHVRHESQLARNSTSAQPISRLPHNRQLLPDLNATCEWLVEFERGNWLHVCTCEEVGQTGMIKYGCPSCVTCYEGEDFCISSTYSVTFAPQEQTIISRQVYAYNGSRADVVTLEQPDDYNGGNFSSSCNVTVNNQSCVECQVAYFCNGLFAPGTFFANCSNIEAGAVYDNCMDPEWFSKIANSSVFFAFNLGYFDWSCVSDTSTSPPTDVPTDEPAEAPSMAMKIKPLFAFAFFLPSFITMLFS